MMSDKNPFDNLSPTNVESKNDRLDRAYEFTYYRLMYKLSELLVRKQNLLAQAGIADPKELIKQFRVVLDTCILQSTFDDARKLYFQWIDATFNSLSKEYVFKSEIDTGFFQIFQKTYESLGVGKKETTRDLSTDGLFDIL